MKTSIDKFVEWLEEHHPDAVPPMETLHHLKRVEQMDQQLAYNAGFTKAKSLYLDSE